MKALRSQYPTPYPGEKDARPHKSKACLFFKGPQPKFSGTSHILKGQALVHMALLIKALAQQSIGSMNKWSDRRQVTVNSVMNEDVVDCRPALDSDGAPVTIKLPSLRDELRSSSVSLFAARSRLLRVII